MKLSGVTRSVLDLCPVIAGGTVAEALQRSLDLAQHVEKWNYRRIWLAEHHNMPGIASAATSVVIGFVANGTSTIRVGSGGIMLANHAPMAIAEQFGTLESLFPGRIDLGLGRAPGTDQTTVQFLRRNHGSSGEEFPEQLEELRAFLRPEVPNQKVRAVPGAGLDIPIWLLGSGGFSAQLAGRLGLPFGSAGHFSPDSMMSGLELYRRSFKPSGNLKKPYVLVCVNIFAADSSDEAQKLATSHQLAMLQLSRGMPTKLPAPLESMDGVWSLREKAGVDSFMRGSIIGDAEEVKAQLEDLVEATHADELMIHSMIYDHVARLRSYEIVSEIMAE